MTRFSKVLLGSALVCLIAGHGFAADAAPEAAQPAAASPSVAAPAAVTAPAPTAPVAAAAPATPAVPSASPEAAAPAQELKVGFINMNRIAAETKEGKAATARLADKSEKAKKKIEAKQKQLEKQRAAIEAKLATMTPQERQAKGEEFQKKVEEFQKSAKAAELEVADLQDKLTSKIFLKIKDTAVEYAKANGYAILVEEKSVLYAVDTLKPRNITDAVIDAMNSNPAK